MKEICNCRAEYVCKVKNKRESCYMYKRLNKMRKNKHKEIFKLDLFKTLKNETTT